MNDNIYSLRIFFLNCIGFWKVTTLYGVPSSCPILTQKIIFFSSLILKNMTNLACFGSILKCNHVQKSSINNSIFNMKYCYFIISGDSFNMPRPIGKSFPPSHCIVVWLEHVKSKHFSRGVRWLCSPRTLLCLYQLQNTGRSFLFPACRGEHLENGELFALLQSSDSLIICILATLWAGNLAQYIFEN